MLNAEKVIGTINQTLNLSLDPATTPQLESLQALGIDSLDFYSVLAELESMTGRNVPDEDIENLKTIQNLVNYFS